MSRKTSDKLLVLRLQMLERMFYVSCAVTAIMSIILPDQASLFYYLPAIALGAIGGAKFIGDVSVHDKQPR